MILLFKKIFIFNKNNMQKLQQIRYNIFDIRHFKNSHKLFCIFKKYVYNIVYNDINLKK